MSDSNKPGINDLSTYLKSSGITDFFERSLRALKARGLTEEEAIRELIIAAEPLKEKLIDQAREYSHRTAYCDENFEPTFPLEEPNPLVEEGDLREIYRCKTERIPTWMPENAFSVHKSTPARIIWDDLELIEGLHRQFLTGSGLNRKRERIEDKFPFARVEIFGEDNDNPKFIISKFKDIELKSPFKGKYLIVDVGHAHLVGVAYKLMQKGVDCSYVIRHDINYRFEEALKYWAGRYKEAKEGLDDIVGYATMLDCHRTCDENNPIVEPIHFPSPDRLREMGVEEIIYLRETKVGKTYHIRYDPDDIAEKVFRYDDTVRILHQYEEAGFPVKCLGIDYRHNRREEI